MSLSTERTSVSAAMEPGAMGHPAAAEPPTLVEQSLPTVVSAAWELELLIAGAVTFALLQLPGSLESLRVSLEPRATGGWAYALIMTYLYAKVMVYTLLAAFLLNLTARAYWVGLVGLHSVYPRGVDWERIRLGPAAIETYRARLVSLPSVIARVDNFASVIFSFAFLIVVVCLFSLVMVGVLGGFAAGANALLFRGRHGLAVFETVVFGFTLPMAAVGLIDKKFGSRWPADSPAGLRLRRLVRLTARVNGTAMFGPIFFTLFTNIRRGVMMAIFYVAFLGALVFTMIELFARLGLFASATPRYAPDLDYVRGVDPALYESLRTEVGEIGKPTIQSDVIEGPYVRLFVPYASERIDPALATSCAGVQPLRPDHVHFARPPVDRVAAERKADTVLGCLTRMFAVALDGAPQPTLPFRFYTHPSTGQKGLIAYLPTANLRSGMHTLSVRPPPRAPDNPSTRPLVATEILFWK